MLPAPRSAGPAAAVEPADRIAALAEEAGEPVDEVLREVADFRLALETDLIIAAAALDAEEAGLAAEMIDGERAELTGFRDRVLDRLAEAAAADELDELAERRLRPLPFTAVSQLVAAAAAVLIVVLAGTVVIQRTDRPATNEVASQGVARAEGQLAQLSHAALQDDAAAAQVAAAALHDTIQELITEHGDDPDVAEQLVSLLTNEVALIKAQPELRAALARAISLARQLKRRAPVDLRPTADALVQAASTPAPKASPKSASPKPSPTASPTPSKSPSPTPSRSSSSPSPSPSSAVIPGSPTDGL